MQRISAWIALVIIAIIVAVVDARSLVSVLVPIAPIFAKMIAAPKSRQQLKDATQSRSIMN